MSKKIAIALVCLLVAMPAAVVLLNAGSTPAGAQASGSRGSQGRASGSRASGARMTYTDRLWSWLSRSVYRNWAPAPGQDGGFYKGTSPHGAQLKLYLNRTAAGDPKTLPPGSVIVKENYTEDKKLDSITLMHRSKGFNPDADDWYWVKYNPDGTVAKKGDATLAGAVKGCIGCHSGADGEDFAFFND